MKQIIQRLTLGLAAVLLFTSQLKAGERFSTGIQGHTYLYVSYGTPVEVESGVWIGVPALQLPVATKFSIVSARTRREVAHGASDANGAFAVALPPGKYILVPHDLVMIPGHPIATAPIEVTVRRQELAIANVFYFQNGPLSVFALSGR